MNCGAYLADEEEPVNMDLDNEAEEETPNTPDEICVLGDSGKFTQLFRSGKMPAGDEVLRTRMPNTGRYVYANLKPNGLIVVLPPAGSAVVANVECESMQRYRDTAKKMLNVNTGSGAKSNNNGIRSTEYRRNGHWTKLEHL